MRFHFKELSIKDIKLILPAVYADNRGFFAEVYRSSEFKKAGIDKHFCQLNNSHSKRGVIRGLHYQLNPYAQAKLIWVLSGEIFDLAADIRKGSKTYGMWAGAKLSAENKHMLYIPEGFAHGFCTLSQEADIMYACTSEYAPDHDRGIVWNDPDLKITWPVKNNVLSSKDSQLPRLCDAENNFEAL